MVLQDALSAVDVAKQFYKIIWSENNFYIFYDKSVTIAGSTILTFQILYN